MWGLIVLYYIWKWVPQVEGLPDTGFKGTVPFLEDQSPLAHPGSHHAGQRGVFCWYSYINPLLTQVSGFPTESVTLLMVLAGFGMVVGNLLGDACRTSTPPAAWLPTPNCCSSWPARHLFRGSCRMAHRTAHVPVHRRTLCRVEPQQISIIHFAKGGELLGAACVQVAFNLGNAIGAFLGGLPLEAGLDYHYPALIGAPLALVGFVLLTLFYKKYESTKA